MKRIYLTLLLAVAAVACQEEILQPELPVSDGQMRFNLTAPGVQTKAFGNAFAASDKIGIYVTDYDDQTPMPLQVSGNRANNMSMTYNGTVWTPRKPVYWGEGKTDVYAYYPYIESITDVNAQPFTLALDQNCKRTDEVLGGYEASDLLWAKATGVSQEDGTVNLAMKHILSKLTVKIVAGEDYVGSLPEDASVLIHSTVPSVKIDFETGSVVKDSHSGAQSIEMKKLGLRTSNGVDAVVYEAIVVPQMLETTVPLFEINSKSISYLVEDAFNFRPGVAYTYTITLNTSTNAIKVDMGCELDDWNSTGGDNSGEPGEEEGEEGDDNGMVYTNLSAEGTANCYIVSEAGAYKFKAVQGNLDATVGNVKKVEVLWESFGTDVVPNVGDLIASVSYKDGYIRFTTPETYAEGNAVIAAKNSEGTVLWSWHIWLTDQPEVHMYNKRSGLLMDRNLGATSAEPGSVGALGLLYQWGRKDPFLGSSSISYAVEAMSTGTWHIASMSGDYVDEAEKNPTTFYTSSNCYQLTWASQKTTSDPCPVGWRVPDEGAEGFWEKSELYRTDFDYYSRGMNFNIEYPDLAWYPAAGKREYSTGKLEQVGTYAYCQSAIIPSHLSDNYGYTYGFGFTTGEFGLSWGVHYGYHHNASSVRCWREYDESLVPETVQPNIDVASSVSLSEEGTANSYIVSAVGTYAFPAVKGNGSESVGPAVDATIVWESFGTEEKPNKGDLIAGAICQDGMVYFKTADVFREGNALIAVRDEKGNILWSWHIWMTDEPQEQVYYNGAGTMMDRNLGATSATAGEPGLMGLRYQWGRKDPFMGELQTPDDRVTIASSYLWPTSGASPDSPIEYAISHPTVVMGHGNFGDWIYVPMIEMVDNTRWQSDKTICDPCPAGWRVPDGGEESVWYKATQTKEQYYGTDQFNFSSWFGDNEPVIYPHAGYLYNVDTWTYYWTCTPHPRKHETASIDALAVWGTPAYGVYARISVDYCNRVDMNYIRCQKE